ncbi:peptidoglycan DD-metalloendopeptidase family protein [Candidatus Poriferisocius sp.]|uniref:peptidoglycan DD-metalloendopeptidase family protein n=1 Tax=Candidatus Poriferisocius sp. TaxID=3101276 RepID=UPI003B5C2AF4
MIPKFARIALLVAATQLLVLSATGVAQDTFVDERRAAIEQRERDIEERRRQQEVLQNQALFAVSQLDATNAQIEEVDAYLTEINGWIAAAQTRLEAVELSRTAARQRADNAQERQGELSQEITAIRERLRGQVVQIYLDLVEEENFLLEDGDPNRNARRQYYIEELGADAQVLIDRLRRASDDLQAAIDQAEQAQTEFDQAQTEIQATLAELEDLRQAQEKLQEEWDHRRQELQDRIDAEAEVQRALEDEIAGLNQEISGFENEIERENERRRLEEERRKREAELARLAELERQRQADLDRLADQASGGQFDDPDIAAPPEFFQPVPGTIGSGFGNRVHPIFGTVRFHAGADFGGNTGDPIRAAASGTVTQAQWREGYGNTVVVDHGDDWTTLYAHLSGFNASVGQQVEIGDVIGYVGSTGWSTGPHLHFEVRYRGSPRDPALYLNA